MSVLIWPLLKEMVSINCILILTFVKYTIVNRICQNTDILVHLKSLVLLNATVSQKDLINNLFHQKAINSRWTKLSNPVNDVGLVQVDIVTITLNVACSRLDIADKLLVWC